MMDLARLRRLHELYGEAGALAGGEFARFVADLRATDAEMAAELFALRQEVERASRDESLDAPALHGLLDGDAQRAVDDGLRMLAADPHALASAPASIEGFRLLRRIGEGGMGIVFEAEQDAPRRRVAIKLMHPSPRMERLRRFELEAAVLGRLHHPHIAQIHAYGTHHGEHGEQPWFAMELVDGVDLRTHAERARLDPGARLVLFGQVVDAVHHAHERGVVHRDLKPDNVLVDSRGAAKVLDFGVAHAKDTSLDLASLATKAGDLIGTLAYMAPEQLAGTPDAITVRSDVYALGVMLYQLLSGRLPHEVAGLPIAAAVHVLTHQPAAPLARFDPRLRGDLATIVGKAMARDPARRYATAADLAADIRRHLEHRPIQARPASVVYRATTMLRRNRALASGLGAAFAALAFGLGGMTWQAHAAGKERDRALRASYSANVIGAGDALARAELAAAREYLDAAPAVLRDWEWRLLDAQLDTSVAGNERNLPSLEPWLVDLWPIGDGASYWLVDNSSGGSRDSWDRVSGRGVAQLPAGRWLRAANGAVLTSCVLGNGPEPTVRVTTHDGVTGARLGETVVGVPANVRTALAHPGSWYCPDGRFVFAPIDGGLARLDLQRRVPDAVQPLFAEDRYPERVAMSPDGRSIAVTSPRVDPVMLLDVESLRVVAPLPGHTNTVESLVFSPDGSLLVTTSSDQTARLWDVTTAPPVCRFVLQHPLAVPNAAFSPDGQLLATICIDRMLRVFRLTDGALLSTFGSSRLLPRPLAFFDAATVAGVESGGSVRYWNVRASATALLRGHRAPVEHVVLAPRFGAVVSAGVEGFRGEDLALRVVDVASGDTVAEYFADGSVVRAMELATDGTTLHLQLARLRDRLQLHQCKLDLRSGARSELPATNRAVGFKLDPTGRTIAVAEDGLAIVDAASGEPLRRNSHVTAVPQRMWWSRDGLWIFGLFRPDGDATGSQGVLFDARTLCEVHRFPPSQDVAFAVSPDERLVALAGGDAVVRVFELHGGSRVAELRGHDLTVFCVAFSPDGRRLASSGHDRGIRLWDVQTFDAVARLSGHEDTVMDLSWDGNDRLISCGHDDTVRIWESAPLRTRVAAHTARQASVARMQPRVEAMFAATSEAGRVFDAIEKDAGLGELDRKVAHQIALRITLGRAGTK